MFFASSIWNWIIILMMIIDYLLTRIALEWRQKTSLKSGHLDFWCWAISYKQELYPTPYLSLFSMIDCDTMTCFADAQGLQVNNESYEDRRYYLSNQFWVNDHRITIARWDSIQRPPNYMLGVISTELRRQDDYSTIHDWFNLHSIVKRMLWLGIYFFTIGIDIMTCFKDALALQMNNGSFEDRRHYLSN